MTALSESTGGHWIDAGSPSRLERIVLVAAHRMERLVERRVRRRMLGAAQRARASAQHERRRADAAALGYIGILPR